MADFILNMPPGLFARVFGNPAGDPVLLKSRGVTLLRDTSTEKKFQTGLYPGELTGELLRILSVIRVQQKKKKRSKFIA